MASVLYLGMSVSFCQYGESVGVFQNKKSRHEFKANYKKLTLSLRSLKTQNILQNILQKVFFSNIVNQSIQ